MRSRCRRAPPNVRTRGDSIAHVDEKDIPVDLRALHWFAGLPTVFAAGFVGGFYFSLTYDRWRKESLVAAIAMTFLLHSTFNLVGAVALIIASLTPSAA